jgi:hypothetical protein
MMSLPLALVWSTALSNEISSINLPDPPSVEIRATLKPRDALLESVSFIMANCNGFSRLASTLTQSEDNYEKAALTAIEVWCGGVPSRRLSADLQREPSTALFYAIRTWRLAATNLNPNAELNIRLVQTWFAKNADSEWAINHFERVGGGESATMTVASGLNSLDAMDAIREFPDVTPRLKAWLTLPSEMRYSVKPRPPWVNLPER